MDDKPRNGTAKQALEELEENEVDELMQLEAVQKRINGRGKA